MWLYQKVNLFLFSGIFEKVFDKSEKYDKINQKIRLKFLPLIGIKKIGKKSFKGSKNNIQELRKMVKNQQKITKKIKKKTILMSEKNSVAIINRGFSRKNG